MVATYLLYAAIYNWYFASEEASPDFLAQPLQLSMKTGYVTIAEGFWGKWLKTYDAPKGYLACGMALRDEPGQGWGDDSALNAIKLIYCKIDKWDQQEEVYLNHGIWGIWQPDVKCPKNHFINGVQAKLEENQGSSDDSALNGLRIKCQDPKKDSDPIVRSLEYGGWGDWLDWVEYPGSYICGGQVRFQEDQGKGDDTALNGVRFNFCKYDNIKSTDFEYYISRAKRNPSPLVVDSQIFDNKLSTEQTYKFEVSRKKSVTYTWENMLELTYGMEMSVEAEVPIVGGAEITVSASTTLQFTKGQEVSTEHSFVSTIEVKVPPCTKVSVSYVATEDKVDIPYQAKITYDDDSVEYITGTWRGVGYYNGHAETKPIEKYENC